MLLRIASLMVVASCVAPAQVRISIVPATGQEISSATGNHWSLTGSTLKRAIAELFEITPTRIELPAELDDNKIYDFNIEVPPSKRTSMVTLMEQAIEKQFGI